MIDKVGNMVKSSQLLKTELESKMESIVISVDLGGNTRNILKKKQCFGWYGLSAELKNRVGRISILSFEGAID